MSEQHMEILAEMGFSEAQSDLLDVATSFCRDKSPIAKVRALMNDEAGYDPSVWHEIGTLGWLAIAIPEQYGGVGLGLAEVVPVVEQMGRRMFTAPFIATTLAAQAIMHNGTEHQKLDILPKIAAGAAAAIAVCEEPSSWDLTQLQATARRDGAQLLLAGTKYLVLDAAAAHYIIVSVMLDGAPVLVLVERYAIPPSALRREVIIDETKRSYALTLDGISVPTANLLDTSRGACFAHLQLAATLLIAAENVGAAQSVIDYTADYLTTRKQFGNVIGAYQALKHPIVAAYVGYGKARSHLYSAAHCFTAQGKGEIATRMAAVQGERALAFAADRSIQFHGGFGFTYDCDAQLYRRRAIFNAALFGDAGYHKRKLADLLL
jgi:acyl-CoA dehydrogenase